MTYNATNHTIDTPAPKTIKKTIQIFKPYSQRHSPTAIVKETLPEVTSLYTVPDEQNTPLDIECREFFDDFLFLEIEKLQNLTQMFNESEYSCNSTFGEIMIDMLNNFSDRLRDAAHYMGV